MYHQGTHVYGSGAIQAGPPQGSVPTVGIPPQGFALPQTILMPQAVPQMAQVVLPQGQIAQQIQPQQVQQIQPQQVQQFQPQQVQPLQPQQVQQLQPQQVQQVPQVAQPVAGGSAEEALAAVLRYLFDTGNTDPNLYVAMERAVRAAYAPGSRAAAELAMWATIVMPPVQQVVQPQMPPQTQQVPQMQPYPQSFVMPVEAQYPQGSSFDPFYAAYGQAG